MNQISSAITNLWNQPGAEPARAGAGPAAGSGLPQPPQPQFQNSGQGPSNLNPVTGVAQVPAFVESWRAVMLRKWWIALFAAVIAGLAAFIVSQMTPVYRSTASILIEAGKTKVVAVEDVYGGANAGREYFQTQAENLKSRAVAQKVVQKLNLADHPEFDPRQLKDAPWQVWVRDHVPLGGMLVPKREAVADNEEQIEAAVLRNFAQRLTIEPVRLSQLIRISFEANDAVLAADVANEVGEAFIQADMEARVKITQNAGSFITDQLAQLKQKMEASDKAVQAYREKEGLLDSKSVVLGGMGSQLDNLTQKLVDARVRRSEAEEAYNLVKSGVASNYESVPNVVRNTGVQRAKELEAEVEKKYQELVGRYGPDHPKMVAAESDLKAAKENTRRQIQTIVSSIQKEFNSAVATERMIEQQMAASKGTIQNLNRKEIQVANLEREAATNRALYQTFLSRQKETNATVDAQTPQARMVDLAVPSNKPVRPNKPQTIGIAGLLALLLGIGAALLHRQLNNQVNTREDVELKLAQPLLTALPIMTGKVKKSPATAMIDEPGDVYCEGIRTAGTGLMLSGLETPRKVIAVTSSVPGEGKSTFSINLALWQAKTKPTLLIEADMRRPSLGPQLGLKKDQKGLSDLIAGSTPMVDCIVRNEATGLEIIPAGSLPPNPLELLMSPRFGELLDDLRGKYEIVIIDCPPLQLVSDVLVIGRHVTGLVYVVKAAETPVPMVRNGLRRVIATNIPIVGVVLNQLNYKRAEKYYGDYGGYGKYGYKYGYK